MNDYKIGDCLELMKELPDNSVNLAILDPPYYKIVKDDWDNQWKTLDSYISWLETVLIEVKRVLKDNGSLYIFGDDRTIAYVQVMADKHFTYLNNLVWYKRNSMTLKWAQNNRRFTPCSERLLFYSSGREGDLTGRETIYSEKDCFKSIKSYMRSERAKVMEANSFKTVEEFNIYIREITNTKSVVDRHYFADSQYCFPTKELYEYMQKTGFFQREYEELRREYEELRREYEEPRREYEELRRPFNYIHGVYEVFDIPIIGGRDNTEHTTTKPTELIKMLIKCASNPGDLILDPFLGSGTTLRACRETGRDCVGFEKDPKYESIIKERALINVPELSSY